MAKRVWIFVLSLCCMFSLVACSNNGDSSSVPSTADTSRFEKPENYAVVLLATINPQIKLYLADDGKVLAVEAVNEDAQQIVGEIMTENADYQAVIKAFVSAAKAKDFIHDGAKLELEIVETKDEKTDTKAILNQATAAAEAAANELDISLEVVAVEAADSDEPNSDDETSAPASDDNTQPEEPHTHQYSNGTCTVCGATIPALNPKNELDKELEYIGNLRASGDMLYGAALRFDEDGVCVVISREFSTQQNDPNQKPIVFNGTNYYSMGGGQDPHNVELTDTEVIVKGSIWGEDPDTVTFKLTLQSNGMLEVTYSTNSDFPVGIVLSTDINDVLS